MTKAPHRFSNEEIADQLEEAAELLRAHEGDGYRMRAYRRAADTVRHLDEPAIAILDRDGQEGLVAVPTIGRSIAAAIDEMAHRGRWLFLDRLRGEVTAEELFMTLPGVGETLAARIHDALDVETLEDLEVAAHDGRLEKVPGVGPRRAHAIRDLLAAQLSRSTRRRARRISWPRDRDEESDAPPISLLLSLDAEYRRRAERDALPKITPRRFNEEAEKWLPIWHTEAEGWGFTFLFSNTALAHRLGKTRDWVVVYWEKDGHEAQATIVTEYRGELRGRRVVRGRERECAAHFAHSAA